MVGLLGVTQKIAIVTKQKKSLWVTWNSMPSSTQNKNKKSGNTKVQGGRDQNLEESKVTMGQKTCSSVK